MKAKPIKPRVMHIRGNFIFSAPMSNTTPVLVIDLSPESVAWAIEEASQDIDAGWGYSNPYLAAKDMAKKALLRLGIKPSKQRKTK